MTSLAVAQEATSPKPTNEATRTLLWSGGVVEMKVFDRAKAGYFGEGDDRIDFIQFAVGVPGGLVNMFVHSTEYEKYVGKHVIAEATVHRKEFKDGRAFLYVDLLPTDKKPTHWLTARPRKEGATHSPGAVVFKTPEPLRGEIVITELNSNSSNDIQLDRYLADGWTISADHPTCVHLTKGEEEKLRCMVHHKPKKKK